MPRIGTCLVWVSLLTGAPALAACPFCPPSSPPLAEQLAESDLAGLVKWVKTIPVSASQPEPQTELVVVEALRLLGQRPKVEEVIRVPYLLEAEPGDLFVMMGKQTEGITDWSLPIPVTEISYQYIKQAPSMEQPAADRLKYFLKFLEFSDRTISNDAFSEFGRAQYADVVAIRGQLSRATIRKWMASLQPDEQIRLGFYGMLLGLCGNDDDAQFLEQEVSRTTPPTGTRLGLDGMMGGYVILTGEMGLKRLIQWKLQTPDQPDGDVYALVNTLRFLWQFAPERAPRAQIEAAMESLLDRPTFAEVAVVDLARWQCWQVTERVLAMYGKPPFDDPSAKRTIIQFALTCEKKLDDRQSETKHPAAAAARKFLADLKQTDPETLKLARSFFGNRSPETAQ